MFNYIENMLYRHYKFVTWKNVCSWTHDQDKRFSLEKLREQFEITL